MLKKANTEKNKPVGGICQNKVVQSDWHNQSDHGLSPYKITKPQQNANKFSLLWFCYFAHLNAFASTPSWNRTSNSPLGGVCYIHLTMGANALSRKRQPSP